MPTNKNINRAGYLRESFHYFHLRDTAGQELDFHFHAFDKLVILLSGRVPKMKIMKALAQIAHAVDGGFR